MGDPRQLRGSVQLPAVFAPRGRVSPGISVRTVRVNHLLAVVGITRARDGREGTLPRPLALVRVTVA
jgi:hypothetical protein